MAKSPTLLMLIACMFIACIGAEIILDKSLKGVDILHLNATTTNELSPRALPVTRRNLGRIACGEHDVHAGRRITQQWKLARASCRNDKDFHVKCRQYIPNNGDLKEEDSQCSPTETCGEDNYTNVWGRTSTDVFCQSNDEDREDSWSITSSDTGKNACGPGLTNKSLRPIPEGNEKLSISIQFYNGMSTGKRRTNVSKAWLQSNKKGIIKTLYSVNGLFWRGTLNPSETIQACFIHDTKNDAFVAYEDWTTF